MRLMTMIGSISLVITRDKRLGANAFLSSTTTVTSRCYEALLACGLWWKVETGEWCGCCFLLIDICESSDNSENPLCAENIAI